VLVNLVVRIKLLLMRSAENITAQKPVRPVKACYFSAAVVNVS